MNKGTKISISPDTVEVLKEKYGVSEETIKEIMGNIEVKGPVEAVALPDVLPKESGESTGEMQILRQLGRGEVGMGEAIMYMDIMDRKERRERRDEREEELRDHPPASVSAEDIGKHVGAHVNAALKEAGVIGKTGTTKDEMPDWAKEIHKQQDEILKHMQEEGEDKKLKESIEKVTTPLKTELEKAQEKIKELSSKPTDPGTGRKGMLDEYIDTRGKLKEAGLLKEDTSGSLLMMGPDGKPMQGLPVKGELPAWMVYGPYFIDQMGEAVEKRIDKIATKYGLSSGPGETEKAAAEPLIKMPPKPPPAAPPTEAEAPEAVPKEKVLALPEKPAAPTPPTPTPPEETEEEITEEEVPERPCARCGKLGPLLPSGLHKSCAEELAKEVTPTEVASKQYFCVCGAGPFEKSWQKALHAKSCPKAKEMKAKEKATKNEQKREPTGS